MRITAIDVMSLNGKITRGEDADAHTWSSDEDWQHFTSVLQAHDLIVMGRGTYESVHPEPDASRLRIVLTHHPEAYQDVPGQLEFVNQSPAELVAAMTARGFTKMLLVGGQTNTQFFNAGLVDELIVTIEPLVFATGRDWLSELNADLQLQLQSVKQLNQRGTLLAQYQVLDAPGTKE